MVHGDDDARVHRCSDCDSHMRIWKGSAAELDVDRPDPTENPGRHGPRAAEWRE